MRWDDIGALFGVTGQTIKARLDEVYASKRRASVEASRAPGVKRAPNRPHRAAGAGDGDDIALARIAPDTRTWQQRFFGDPPKERSALAGRK